jgi:hypothetical protein
VGFKVNERCGQPNANETDVARAAVNIELMPQDQDFPDRWLTVSNAEESPMFP